MLSEQSVVIECLKHSIEDAQATIRGYDTKAEILGILLTLALGITNFTSISHYEGLAEIFILGSWLCSLGALGLLGLVLHPKLNSFKSISFGTYTPSCVYFLHNVTGAASNSVSDLAIKAKSTDWEQELMYESMKLSLIREKKHRWFILSLKVTALTLSLIVASMVTGSIYD
jgi:hypothetical protein